MKNNNRTERTGVHEVGVIVERDLGWVFREQPVSDMGIDAHIEYRDATGFPAGKLIGAQIKTGPTHVRRADDKLVYYGKRRHLNYWLSHSLPVVLIVHIPGEGVYWQAINTSTIQRTQKRWKVEIPLANVFGTPTQRTLGDLFQGTPQQQKQNHLAADEFLMRHIAKGGKIVAEMEDRVNQSLSTPVNLYTVNADGNDELSKAYELRYSGYSIEQVAKRLFPWAHIQIDDEFYDLYGPEESDKDRVRRAQNLDNGIEHIELTPDDIRPYDEVAGEVENYRLKLTLNEVGKAYLLLMDYLQIPDDTWTGNDDDDETDDGVDLSVSDI